MARVKDGKGRYESTRSRRTEAPTEEAPTEEAPTEEAPSNDVPSDDGNEEEADMSSPSKDIDDDSQPMQPEKLFFGPTEYSRPCKIATRCYVNQTVDLIKKLPSELKWFTKHSQFKHIFHMSKEPNRKLQGMWMLLLRTASTDKQRECWFVVNGVPIRYSLREHALLCGFDCHEYPNNWKELGDFKFVLRQFGRKEKIKVADVEEKLESMRSCVDRMKMAVLYFLCKVLKAKSKVNGSIDPFLLRVVDDLEVCKTFPWGRYTFDDCINEIQRMMKKFKDSVKEKATWTFSGFILPLEALAFECIPDLGRTFREDVAADKDCPRLCKHKFRESSMKGFPLEDITEAIGSTKNITSILEPDSDEKALMARIIDNDFDDGIGYIDPIVESWTKHLVVQKKKIWWKDLYDLDVASRGVPENVDDEVPEQEPENVASVLELQKAMEKGFKEIMKKFDDIEGRLTDLESYVNEQLSKEVWQDGETGGAEHGGGDNGNERGGEEDEMGETGGGTPVQATKVGETGVGTPVGVNGATPIDPETEQDNAEHGGGDNENERGGEEDEMEVEIPPSSEEEEPPEPPKKKQKGKIPRGKRGTPRVTEKRILKPSKAVCSPFEAGERKRKSKKKG